MYAKRILLLSTITLLLILTGLTIVAADGCCIGWVEGATASYDASCIGEYVNTPMAGFIPMNQSICEDYGIGNWSTYNCSAPQNSATCALGCCCGGAQGYLEEVPEYACLGEDEWKAAQDCSIACSSSSEEYTIRGTVYEADGTTPIDGINVTLDVPQLIVQTDADGHFTFEDVKYGDRILSAANESCTKSIYPFVRQNSSDDDYDDYTILFECTGTGAGDDECEPKWTDCGFNGQNQELCDRRYDYCTSNNCGETLNWADYYNGDPEPYKPLPFKACPVQLGECNYDGNVDTEEGEQCDGNDFAEGVLTTCEDYGYAGTETVGCTDCRVDTSNCQSCPPPNSYCTREQCTLCPDVCGETPSCQLYNCLEAAPTLGEGQIIFPEGTHDAQLQWGFNQACIDNVNTFVIQQCSRATDDTESCPEDCDDDETCEEHATASIILDSIEDDNVFRAQSGIHTYGGINGIVADRTYCFRVIANIQEGERFASNSNGGYVCADSGQEICMNDPPAEFCDTENNAIVTCNNNKPVRNNCPDGTTCYFSEKNEEAFCSAENTCNLCNGLFGMYGHFAYTSGTTYAPLVPYLDGNTMSELECNDPSIFGPEHDTYTSLCFDGATKTIANKLDSCSGVESCYDYTTQQACMDDQCHKGLNCGWNEFDPFATDGFSFTQESGLGVCVPNGQPEQQQCGKCNEQDHLLPACTEQLCYLYNTTSNGCLYTEQGMCIGKEQATCTDYKTPEECEGAQDYDLDITYVNKNPVAGTHERLNLSDDHFGFGVCEWIEERNRCIKNADAYITGSYLSDCANVKNNPLCPYDYEAPETTLLLVDYRVQPWDLDHPVYSLNNLFGYVVSDNTFSNNDTDTFFGYNNGVWSDWVNRDSPATTGDYELLSGHYADGSVSCDSASRAECRTTSGIDYTATGDVVTCLPTGFSCINQPDNECDYDYEVRFLCPSTTISPPTTPSYPTLEEAELKAALRQQGSGTYIISYYSKDDGGNYEEVDYRTITIDADEPTVTAISNATHSFQVEEDEWRTNLNITFTVTDDHGPISCDTTLEKFSEPERRYPGDREYVAITSGTSLTNNYYFLPDDYWYTFKLSCTDHPELNNSFAEEYIIYIEADQSIKNPRPKWMIYTLEQAQEIELTIQTNRTATQCRYGTFPDVITSDPPGTLFTPQNDDNTSFSATITDNAEGLHEYYTGCMYEDDNVMEANPSDMIRFSVDDSAPITYLVNDADGEIYAPNFFKESTILSFEARDQNENLIKRTVKEDGTEKILLNGNAQAVKTYYCVNHNHLIGSCDDFIEWDEAPLIFNDENIADGNIIHYYSVDGIGNTEAEKEQAIFVRDLSFYITGVQICYGQSLETCIEQLRPS